MRIIPGLSLELKVPDTFGDYVPGIATHEFSVPSALEGWSCRGLHRPV